MVLCEYDAAFIGASSSRSSSRSHGSSLYVASVIMLKFYKKCLSNRITVSMNEKQEQKLFGPPPMKNSKLFKSASKGFTEKIFSFTIFNAMPYYSTIVV